MAGSTEVYSLEQRRPACAMAEAKGGLLASVYPVSCASTDGQNGTDPCVHQSEVLMNMNTVLSNHIADRCHCSHGCGRAACIVASHPRRS